MKSLALSLLAVALLATFLASGFWGDSYDDAYITYQYAQRWARGDGLTFNDGERVLGTSAPGYALALGGLDRWAGIEPPAGGSLLSLLALGGLVLLLGAMAGPRHATWPLLFALTALTCRWNIEMLGAETLPAAALGTLAVWLALRRDQATAAGLAAAAAMLCRTDLVLLATLLGAVLWWRQRRPPWRYALAGLLPPALLGIWLTSYFGSPLPATLAGKQSERSDALGYSADQWHWLGRTLTPSGRAALMILAAIGLLIWIASRRRSGAVSFLASAGAVLAAGVLALQAFYRLAGVPFAPWYEVAALNGLLALATFGAARLGALVGSRLPTSGLRPIVAGLVGLALSLPLWQPGLTWAVAQHGEPPDPRQELYCAVGEYLAREAPPSARVAAVEIGVLGYYADRPVLDLVGLIDPAVVAARADGRLGDHVAAVDPTYLLDAPVFRQRFVDEVLGTPGIGGRYRPAAAFVSPAYEGDPVVLLRRP
ncbi:MAG: hypothetical protein AAF604_23005 [Acidobacteriota bacterium]